MSAPNLGVLGTSLRNASSSSQLSALPDVLYPDGSSVYVVNQSGTASGVYWYLDKKNVSTPNVVSVVSTKSGVGRWVIDNKIFGIPFVSVKQFGAAGDGVTDDAPAIQAGVNALAGTGSALWFPQGTYLCQSSGIAIPSNTHIMGGGQGQAVIKSGLTSLAGGISTQTCLFLGLTQTGPNISLNADVAEGATQIQITGATISKGQTFLINNGVYGAVYTAIAVIGSSPQTITLDRATLYPYPHSGLGTTCVVNVLTQTVDNVLIEGLTFTGFTNNVTLEFFGGCRNVRLKDITFDYTIGSTPAGLSMDWDLYDYDCHAQGLRVINAAGSGVGFDTCEACSMTDTTYTSNGSPTANTSGIELNNSPGCTVDRFSVNGAYYGVWVYQQAPPSTIGNKSTQIMNGVVTGCTSLGMNLNTSTDTLVQGVNVEGCTSGASGISVASTSTNVRLIGCNVRNNGDTGLVVNAGSTGTFVYGCEFSNNTKDAVTTAQEMYIAANAIIRDTIVSPATLNNSSAIYITDSGGAGTISTLVFDGVTCVRGADNGTTFNILTNGPRVRFTNCTIGAGSSSGYGILLSNSTTSVAVVDNCKITGSTGIFVGSGTTLRAGANIVNTATTPITISSGYYNRKQTVVANGITGVNVNFPDINANDSVLFTLQTIGGTVGHPKYTITAGTKFVLTSDASDTSTYEYYIP